jgi:hypothetical protein
MKPSTLIKWAIKDLEKCEEDPKYKIDMSNWHDPFCDVCRVCLAGAVMAQRLSCNSHTSVMPHHVGGVWQSRLIALNSFRMGHVRAGLSELGLDPNGFGTRKHAVYEVSPAKFKKQMIKLSKDLKEAGL